MIDMSFLANRSLMAKTKGYSPTVRNRDVCENRGLLAHLAERACRERDLYNL